jgi:hypothetical protein
MKLLPAGLCLCCTVFLLTAQTQQQSQTPQQGSATPKNSPAAQAATTQKKGAGSSSQNTQYTSIAKGGKLPYGKSVTLTGQLSDFKCGTQAISDVLAISGVSASYLGQTSPPGSGTITGNTWTVSLGSLPADATINLQLKITGKLTPATADEITRELLSDPRFIGAVRGFFAATNDQPSSPVTSAMAAQEAEMALNSISAKDGALTQILGRLLPSCTVATDVTTAAMVGLRANETALLNIQTRVSDLLAPGVNLTGLDPHVSAGDAYKYVQSLSGQQADSAVVKLFKRDYEAILGAFGVEVVAQLNQGVELTQLTDTADLNKYAGFDAGAIYVPRINELREFYMVHIYPFGPVELDTSGGVPLKARWSIALGASIGDLSGNASSRVKSDKAFVYGVGFRINKYFRISAGAMLYRDAKGNGLLNEAFIGPSIDISALPGLKQVFSSSSGTGGNSSKATSSNPAGNQ